MLEDTLAKLEQRLSATETIQGQQREELLGLVATLRTELGQLAPAHREQAQSIGGFAALSAHEATRQHRNPALVRLSLEGLKSSVDGFEKSHPRLVQVVDRICTTLANLGV